MISSFNRNVSFIASLDKVRYLVTRPYQPHPTLPLYLQLTQACGRFINCNAVTKAAGSSTKSPELLARYCDILLRRSSSKSHEDTEIDAVLDRVVCINDSSRVYNRVYITSNVNLQPLQMIMFKYLEDKDVFQKFYSKLLAKRLVQFNSASDDMESAMIAKLKVCVITQCLPLC